MEYSSYSKVLGYESLNLGPDAKEKFITKMKESIKSNTNKKGTGFTCMFTMKKNSGPPCAAYFCRRKFVRFQNYCAYAKLEHLMHAKSFIIKK